MLRIKEGFKDERFVSLPDTLLDAYAADPLVGNLYLRKIGYFPRVKYHYVLKQQGCDYAMLLYCTEGEGWYRIDKQRYLLHKNQYAVLPPDIPYELGADNGNPWTIYWLHFKGRDCRCYCPDGHAPRDIQPGSESRIQERLSLFEELYRSFSLAYTIDYMRYTSACLHHLLASFLYAGYLVLRGLDLPPQRKRMIQRLFRTSSIRCVRLWLSFHTFDRYAFFDGCENFVLHIKHFFIQIFISHCSNSFR